ncbi:MAG: acetyl-CoA carboxylase carboxyltransferase subunit alpha [Alphaproteobacteria bacterium]|nr:MAG: acetyl-CoA carboxylase carboxyltransferase subunit alpha [Alphaproteobacteria bacterium]
MHVQDFEAKIYQVKKMLEGRFTELYCSMSFSEDRFMNKNVDHGDKILNDLQSQFVDALQSVYANLTPWQKVQVARHPDRPHGLEFIHGICSDFFELHGDRISGDDKAILGGIALLDSFKVMIIAHERGGHDVNSRVEHNFGMGSPEGYRKALRLMNLADELNIPIVSLINTSGAYPGIDAEKSGQGYCLARCLETSVNLSVPNISVILGEGGSGGAISLALSNAILMLEHSVYSVISPEGCAAILWKDQGFKQEAAEAQHLTAQDLYKYKMIDEIISEPVGGAHRLRTDAINNVKVCLKKYLYKFKNLNKNQIKEMRDKHFLAMGLS